MSLPNLITLSRIPMMFVVVGLLYWDVEGRPFPYAATAALVLFVLGALTDWLDGWLARRRQQVSNFGVFMDALTDKIFLLGLLVAMVDLALVPIALMLLILSRELLVTGLRLVAASKGVVVAAEGVGKLKTILQLVAVGMLLLYNLLQKDFPGLLPGLGAPTMGVYWTGLGLFVAATVLTLYSGTNYLVKYRRVVFD